MNTLQTTNNEIMTTWINVLTIFGILLGLMLAIRLFMMIYIWRLKRKLNNKKEISKIISFLYDLDIYLLTKSNDTEAKKLSNNLQYLISEYQIKYEKTK